MKRWDQITIASNVGHSFEHTRNEALQLLAAVRAHQSARQGPVKDLLEKLDVSLQQSFECFRLVHAVATAAYPIYGLESWMLDGEYSSIRHAFDEGCKREQLADMLMTKLVEQVTEARALGPRSNEDWTHLGQAATALGDDHARALRGLFGMVTLVYDLGFRLNDLRRLLRGVEAYRIDWDAHGLSNDIDTDTYSKMLLHFGRISEADRAQDPDAKPLTKAQLKAQQAALKREAKRAKYEAKLQQKRAKQHSATAGCAGDAEPSPPDNAPGPA